jgi:hypothetical protein
MKVQFTPKDNTIHFHLLCPGELFSCTGDVLYMRTSNGCNAVTLHNGLEVTFDKNALVQQVVYEPLMWRLK